MISKTHSGGWKSCGAARPLVMRWPCRFSGKLSMTAGTPKLRDDLVISRQDTKEGIGFVVKDPATGRFFRLKEVEHFIAVQLNGSTHLEAARQSVEKKFGVTFTGETLEHFVQTLGRLGLLEKDGANSEAARENPRTVRGSLLYLRFKAFDPDRLLNRLVKKARFLFTPHFLVLSAAVILVGIGITVINWGEIGQDIRRLYHFRALFFAWLTIFLVIVAHEFAHGLTCKHFGGEVHEIGFMLLYLQPAFYCNVSEAWLFPENSKRLWVTFAGAYFEIFIWALATMTWRLTEPDTWVSFLALVVMATWLLGFVVLNLGGFLVGRYQAIGFILFMLFLLTLFRRRLSKIVGTLPSVFSTVHPSLASMPRSTKLLILFATALPILFFGRMELKVSGEFKVLPIHNSDVRAEVEGIIDEVYVDEGDVVNKGVMIARLSDRDPQADLRKITAEIDEKRAKLKMLKAGTRLEEIELARREAGTAKTRVEEASKYYQEAKDMQVERLSKAKAATEKAKERLKYANQRFAMFNTLFTKQMISLKEFEEAEENAAVRLKELEETEAELKLVLADDLGEPRRALKIAAKEIEEKDAKLKLVLAGSRPEEIEATEAEIARLEAQRRYTTDQLQLLRVVSPISGLITTPKLKEKVGQNVKKGDLIAQVHELKTIRAEIAVSENEMGDVQVGQEVILKARAYPYKSFYGKISSLATTAIKGDNGQPTRTVLVTTEIDNDSFLLKPEMSGNAKIYCGRRSIIDLVTRRFVHYIRVEFWSWW